MRLAFIFSFVFCLTAYSEEYVALVDYSVVNPVINIIDNYMRNNSDSFNLRFVYSKDYQKYARDDASFDLLVTSNMNWMHLIREHYGDKISYVKLALDRLVLLVPKQKDDLLDLPDDYALGDILEKINAENKLVVGSAEAGAYGMSCKRMLSYLNMNEVRDSQKLVFVESNTAAIAIALEKGFFALVSSADAYATEEFQILHLFAGLPESNLDVYCVFTNKKLENLVHSMVVNDSIRKLNQSVLLRGVEND